MRLLLMRSVCVLVFVMLWLPAQERRVVVYVSHDREHSEGILKEFERESGIAVDASFDTEDTKTVGLVNKLIAEKSAPKADVYWNNECGQSERLKKLGLLQAYVSPQATTIPSGMKEATGLWTGFGARARVLIYDTSKIDAADLPRRLEELAEPAFRGMLAMARPQTGTTLTHAGALYGAWGPEKADAWFDGLMANAVRWESGNGPVARTVAEGGRPFGLTDTDDANGMRLDGYPVATIFLDQEDGGLGTLVIPNSVMIIKGASHLAEAQALVDYLLSPAVEARLAAGRAAQMPLQPGVPHPAHVTPVQDIVAMNVDFEEVGLMIETHAARLADRFEAGHATGESSPTLFVALAVLVGVMVAVYFFLRRAGEGGSRRA